MNSLTSSPQVEQVAFGALAWPRLHPVHVTQGEVWHSSLFLRFPALKYTPCLKWRKAAVIRM